MSTDGECVRVANPLWGYRIRASAEVIETRLDIRKSKNVLTAQERSPVGNICLIRVLGTVCFRRRRCICVDKSLDSPSVSGRKTTYILTNEKLQLGHIDISRSCTGNLNTLDLRHYCVQYYRYATGCAVWSRPTRWSIQKGRAVSIRQQMGPYELPQVW
jgi:hypothetical protein